MTLIFLWCIDKIVCVRLSADEELMGCDLAEHFDDECEIKNHHHHHHQMELSRPATSQKFVCPCQVTIVNGNGSDNIGKRRVYHVNEAFER